VVTLCTIADKNVQMYRVDRWPHQKSISRSVSLFKPSS